jgi:hypothetical protein
MTFWTTPHGEKLTFKEFIERWKLGIEKSALSSTPKEKNDAMIRFTWLMIIGLFIGMIVSAIKWRTYWWITIILLAGLGNTSVQLISLYQKKKSFEHWIKFEDLIKKEVEHEQ